MAPPPSPQTLCFYTPSLEHCLVVTGASRLLLDGLLAGEGGGGNARCLNWQKHIRVKLRVLLVVQWADSACEKGRRAAIVAA